MTRPITWTGKTLRIGTRGSPLARWQAEWVAQAVRAIYPDIAIELVEIKTQGDRDRTSPISAIGGMGLFTKEIQRALLDGRVDVAVHSLKDLPTRGPEGLVLGAVPERESVADALIAPKAGTLDQLPTNARVGTGSQRRKAQLLHLRPDLQVVDLRGNVETRLRAAEDGSLDAVVLAEAGLHRLGLDTHVTERLAPPRFLPAVGQGALGIECRGEDGQTLDLLAPLNDRTTHEAVVAERTVLSELEGGCTIPLAAWARFEAGTLMLDAAVFDLDGREKLAVSVTDDDGPVSLGVRAAQRLREMGAIELLASARATSR